jgi:hypothetical protein
VTIELPPPAIMQLRWEDTGHGPLVVVDSFHRGQHYKSTRVVSRWELDKYHDHRWLLEYNEERAVRAMLQLLRQRKD